MYKKLVFFTVEILLLSLLSGCGTIGDKSTSVSVIYAVTAFLSLILLIGYCISVKQKDKWFYLLFSSVLVVNVGYFILSVADTLDSALQANRLVYLGSVFLPLAMLMITLNVCGIKYKRLVPWMLFCVSVIIFFIAASPGYLDIYYKSVTIERINGITVLNKEYGDLHVLYLVYLLLDFAAMIAVIIYSIVKKMIKITSHAVVLLFAVGCNIGVWLLEQLVKIDFEFLSVSYIVTELFLIGLYLMIQELKKQETTTVVQITKTEQELPSKQYLDKELFTYFESQLCKLTPTEHHVYDLYVEGKGTKEVLEMLNIKENTLKYHNKNIYSKLGVSSRKQLVEIARTLNNKKSD